MKIKNRRKVLTYKGQTGRVSAFAQEYGVPARTLYRRMESGWSDEECIEGREWRCNDRQPTITLEHQGHTRTLKQWAKATGVPLDTITTRHKRGWSSEDILFGKTSTLPRGRHSAIMLTFEGKTRSLVEWAAHYNVPYGTVYGRVNRGCTDPKEILFGVDHE